MLRHIVKDREAREANARALERAGGGSVLLDDQLDGRSLAERIDALLAPDRLAAMAERSASFGRPDAADALALAEPEGYVRIFVDEGAPMAASFGAIDGRAQSGARVCARQREAAVRSRGVCSSIRACTRSMP